MDGHGICMTGTSVEEAALLPAFGKIGHITHGVELESHFFLQFMHVYA
jgi:hypothetical protein